MNKENKEAKESKENMVNEEIEKNEPIEINGNTEKNEESKKDWGSEKGELDVIEAKPEKNIINIINKIKEKVLKGIEKLNGLRAKKIKEIKETKNLNELTRISQNKTAALVLASLGAFVFVGWFFIHSKEPADSKEKTDNTQQNVRMDGAADSQFNQDSSQKALEEQQREIKTLNEKLTDIGDQMDFLHKTFDERNNEEIGNNKVAVQDLQAKVEVLETALKLKKSGSLSPRAGSDPEMKSSSRGITTISFSYGNHNLDSNTATGSNNNTSADTNVAPNINTNISTNMNIKPKTVKDYVPPGTFAKAVLLSGADTNAGVHGQTDTAPITMRILDNGTLPNGSHSSLKGCFITAAAYGDASSERGQIRLQRLRLCPKTRGVCFRYTSRGDNQ